MAHANVGLDQTLETLKKASSGMVADALAMAGINAGIAGIRPMRGFEDVKIVGPASTVLFGQLPPGAPKQSMFRTISQLEPGTVMVIDGQGHSGHYTGDNQGDCAKRHGLLGVVVYGGARDVAGFRQIGMPLWCMGGSVADKPKGLAIVAHNAPIELAGVKVKPGDIILADEDGVAVIPQESLAVVLANLKIVAEVEAGMEKAIKSGATVEQIEALSAKKKPKQ